VTGIDWTLSRGRRNVHSENAIRNLAKTQKDERPSQKAAGNLKASKKKSRESIDGIVAAIMALGRIMLCPDDDGPLIWVDDSKTDLATLE